MKKSERLKNRNNLNPSLLKFTQNLISISQKIEGEISKYRSKDNSDDDFFVYHFFTRTLRSAQSIILLTKSRHYHESVLIARNILEGMFYFQAYLNDTSISKKWRLYGGYEDFQKAIRDQGKEKAEQLLTEYEKKFGRKTIDEAKREFNFNKKSLKWYSVNNIFELVKNTGDVNLKKLYRISYYDFSQVTHWTPTGVIGGNLNINAAIAISFQGLYQMSQFVNNKYELKYENDLEKIYKNYIEYHAT